MEPTSININRTYRNGKLREQSDPDLFVRLSQPSEDTAFLLLFLLFFLLRCGFYSTLYSLSDTYSFMI